MRLTMVISALSALTLLAASDTKNDPPVFLAKPEAFKTLVKPDCSHCKDEAKRRAKELRNDDRVLCWIRGYSDGGAIPYRFYLAPYRVISDTYGVFVYDADAGFVRAFEPSVDFKFHGWRNGVMVIKHKDGTLYSALTGLAFDGPNKGKRLQPIATLQSDWGYWLKAYPNAVAFKMYPWYRAVDLPAKLSDDSIKTRPAADLRLGADAPVLGVSIGSETRAYPQAALEASGGILTDTIGENKVVIFWHEPTRSAAAYLSATPVAGTVSKAAPLTFKTDNKNPLAPYLDMETGSHWDIAGRAVEGPMKGKTLQWVDSVQIKWFAWAAEHPRTTIYVGP